MGEKRLARTGWLAGLVLVGAAACTKQEPALTHYYDQHIQPVFDSFCVGNTSPCHKIDPATGTALGNLDLSSFEGVQRRRDVLRNYGSYPQPLLLAKAIPDASLIIRYNGRLLPGEIRHAGGKTLSPNSDAYTQLKRWLDNGATRDGQSPPATQRAGEGNCNPAFAETPAPGLDRASDAYRRFASDIQPMLIGSCGFSTCHGSPQADFQLNCGGSEAARDANFARAAAFVARAPAQVEESELLLRPLAPRAGGLSHTGGSFFPNRDDYGWQQLRDWAALLKDTPEISAQRQAGEQFFANNVMPVLIRRGCALEGCHSPNGFNDFRLRPGSVGFLSPVAIHRNYEAALHEFMALDTPDFRQSRLVKKNLLPASGGITHRGGPLFDDAAALAPCPPSYDPATASALCTLAEWHRIERADRGGQVSPMAMGTTMPIAFVARPPNPDGPLEFDTFRGGADLKIGDAHVGAGGHIERVDNVRSALGPCAGLTGRTDLDIRGPEWNIDATELAFAARVGEAGGLDLYLIAEGGTCTRLTNDGGKAAGPVRIHNFDPLFTPEHGLVFASTRAGKLSPKRLLPATDLFRVGQALDFAKAEQMTFLTASELAPAFMQNGQITFTAEKATPDFYQLAGRRINWDLTDYHPLLAQRAQSENRVDGTLVNSVGYQQATEIREALDRNFLLILSGTDAKGSGGALGVFNRSLGPFEEGRTEVTFVRSMHLADPAATGREGTQGVYRSPSSLPNGEILASYAGNVTAPARDVPRYDLVAVADGGGRRMLLAGGEQSFVEPVLGHKRWSRQLFRNVPQLVFGGHATGDGEANVHFPDLPMLATLLGANLRRGRNVEAFDGARSLAVYEVASPPSANPDPAALLGPEKVFTQRTLLGTAPLEPDGSLRVLLPSRKPVILELRDLAGNALFTMREEHQLGPGEQISPGVSRQLFDGVCGGCHGSKSGAEPDVAVTPDALTGATLSLSRALAPKSLR